MTPSIRNFVEPGRTSPVTRLTMISTKLVDNKPRWGFTSGHNSGNAAQRLRGFAASASDLRPSASPTALMSRSGWGSLPNVATHLTAFANGCLCKRARDTMLPLAHLPRSVIHYVGNTTTRLTSRRQDIEPLHHAHILMCKGVAMHDKASDGPGIEVDPKGDGPVPSLVDVWLPRGGKLTATQRRRARLSGLRNGARDKDGVMPLRCGERLAVYLGDQKMILMDVERMVAKRTINHRPLFVIARNHVVEQWFVWVE